MGLAKVPLTWVTGVVLPRNLVLLTESKASVPATARVLLQMECAKEASLKICHSEAVPGAGDKVQVKHKLALLILPVPDFGAED